MQIRPLLESDLDQIKSIFDLYWNDPEFVEELMGEAREFLNQTNKAIADKYQYYITETDGNIVGIIGFRKPPIHMLQYTKTDSPTELYILASKNHKQGVGKMLIEKMIGDLGRENYSEVVLYSPTTHKSSWGFYDHLGFDRVCEATDPDGEPGQIWRKTLI